MKTIGAMIGDVAGSLFKRPATENYPYERKLAPEDLRGALFWEPAKCTGCMLCIKDCPANAIELIVLDKVNKKFVMRYHSDRCVYCAQCVQNCRFKCLSMSNEQWELASTGKKAFTVYYGRDEDVDVLLEKAAKAGIEEPCAQDPG
jgi:formate hydrogenlyase subunit 6/NADH:ubiquinone oxidoreductase subunit I